MPAFAVEQLSTVIQRVSHERRIETVRQMFHSSRSLRALRPMALTATSGAQPETIMDVINKGKVAQASTSIVDVPAGITDMDLQNLKDISLLDTYVSVASALLMYKNNPGGFDITTPDGAAFFTRTLANSRVRVMTQGLAGVLSLGESVASSFTKETTSADLHLEFLNQIFGSFGFTPAAMKQLDGLMTSIVQSLGSIQASWSDQSQTMDHLISVYYFEPVMGLDVKVPKLRQFFLHIDQKSWTLSVGKSSISKFSFNMNYSDQIGTMSLTQLAVSRDTIQKYITDMTNKSLEEVQKLVAMTAVTQDSSN